VRRWAAALHHTKMVVELTALRATVSSTVELVLGRSPNETSWVEITNELVAKFWRREELLSRLEGTIAKVCELHLGTPPSQASWAYHLAEAVGRLEAELTTRRQVDDELGALWTLVARVRDLVLGIADGPT
jgi:hypothetical protein